MWFGNNLKYLGSLQLIFIINLEMLTSLFFPRYFNANTDETECWTIVNE